MSKFCCSCANKTEMLAYEPCPACLEERDPETGVLTKPRYVPSGPSARYMENGIPVNRSVTPSRRSTKGPTNLTVR